MNIVSLKNGERFEYNGNKFIVLDVDISDFTSIAVGEVGFVKDTGSGKEYADITATTSQVVELAVYTGFTTNNFNPKINASAAVSGAAAASDDGLHVFCLEGLCKALVDGTSDVAKGDPLEVLVSTNCFVLNGTTGTIVYDIKTHAIAAEAQTADAATLTSVYLRGGPQTPSAS